tara:strand:- start:124 stop:414 length:291 start_codon:yes stop_codon:yes gene_type:complete
MSRWRRAYEQTVTLQIVTIQEVEVEVKYWPGVEQSWYEPGEPPELYITARDADTGELVELSMEDERAAVQKAQLQELDQMCGRGGPSDNNDNDKPF